MEELPPAAPVDRYPDHDGRPRNWDGSSWLEIPGADGGSVQPPVNATSGSGSKARRPGRVVAIVAILALIAVGVGGYAVQSAHDATQAALIAEHDATSIDQEASPVKAPPDPAKTGRNSRAAEKAKKAEAGKAAKATADDAERILRKRTVSEIERNIKTTAKGEGRHGLIETIIDVSCDPVAGGSVDDLSQRTTAFQCLVADKKNKDGTMSGYYYNATMNWKAGSYTFGYGKT